MQEHAKSYFPNHVSGAIIGNCILSHTEEAVMGTLKAERNSINIVEVTAVALIKRNINKELDV